MTGFRLHPEAFNDIDEIRAHIAQDDPDAAGRVVTAIFDRIRALVEFPHQGYHRPKLTARSVRFVVVYEYLIASCRTELHCGFWPSSTVGVTRA
jgi:plasmid stabilization system protein ParE